MQTGPVNLTDGRRRVGFFLQIFEQFRHRFAQFTLHLADNHLERHGRGLFLQAFESVREFPGQKVLGLGGNLADFHDRALELTQGIDNLVRHAGIALRASALVIFLTAEDPARALASVLSGHGRRHACQSEESSAACGNRFLCHACYTS